MELRTYHARSIKGQCENPREHEELQDVFRLIDRPCGPPDELEIPRPLIHAWRWWAHRKSMEDGYSVEDSEHHLTVQSLKQADQGLPKRAAVRVGPNVPPSGIYPRSWLEDEFPPDAPEG
eukprot:4424456-Amphidinium_carterae.1